MPPMRFFLCGDVMTGRGIDQILRHRCDPQLHEGYLQDAGEYVRLAERCNGPIPRGVDDAYIWGDALAEMSRMQPALAIVNLETAVTHSDDWLPKGINYRMHPASVGCLAAARIDCCVLANNHVLDWGEAGLLETLDALHAAGLRTAGAGRNLAEAQAPAELPLAPQRAGRLLVHSLATEDSGVPPSWQATATGAGVDWLPELSMRHADALARRIQAARRPGDRVMVSIHWGGNWGYQVPPQQREFAHRLIDAAGVDIVHGHSSHHPKGIELHAGRLILYGCGDFINDYEGIPGHETFRGDIGLMHFPLLDWATGQLLALDLVALRRRRLRLERVSDGDAQWLCGVLNAEGERFGTAFDVQARAGLRLR